MTSEQFAYWLQGFSELNTTAPTQEQWDSIREHLTTVFVKTTPPVRVPGMVPGILLQEQIAGIPAHWPRPIVTCTAGGLAAWAGDGLMTFTRATT